MEEGSLRCFDCQITVTVWVLCSGSPCWVHISDHDCSIWVYLHYCSTQLCSSAPRKSAFAFSFASFYCHRFHLDCSLLILCSVFIRSTRLYTFSMSFFLFPFLYFNLSLNRRFCSLVCFWMLLVFSDHSIPVGLHIMLSRSRGHHKIIIL